jgi:hypothetical protein
MGRIAPGDVRRAQDWERERNERESEMEREMRLEWADDARAEEGTDHLEDELREAIDEHFDRALGETRR